MKVTQLIAELAGVLWREGDLEVYVEHETDPDAPIYKVTSVDPHLQEGDITIRGTNG